MSYPSANGASGRGPGGRFLPGNAGGPGNPMAGHVNRLRVALLNAVTEEDMRTAIAALIEAAKAGSIPAIRELLDRTLGRPVEADLLARLEELETLLEARAP